MAAAAREAGTPVIREAFAARRYNPDASLVARSEPNSLLGVDEAATQAAMTLSEKIGPIKDLQEQLIEDARVRVREKPVAALAIAIAAGFLLSQLLRSR